MKNFLFFVTTVTGLLHASSFEIKSVAEIISFVDSDTLVIFDLDNTVFQAKRYDCHADWYYDQLNSAVKAGTVSAEFKRLTYSQWEESQNSCPVEFVEPETFFELEALRKQDINVMALTARGPGSSGSTLRQLDSLEISFKQTALSNNSVEFKLTSVALFEEGVLFVSPYNPKGTALLDYFNLIGYTPKRIVFVDDLVENLDSLEKSLPGIEVVGLHYPLVAKRRAVDL